MTQIIQLPSAAVGNPSAPRVRHDGPAIRTDTVYAVFTTIDDTITAVRAAGDFAQPLGIPVTLVHFRTVPYTLAVDQPTGISPVETDEFAARLSAECLDVNVRVYLCRDKRQAISTAFKPHSLIVVACQRKWWRTKSDWWRGALGAAGHFVVFIDNAGGKETSHA